MEEEQTEPEQHHTPRKETKTQQVARLMDDPVIGNLASRGLVGQPEFGIPALGAAMTARFCEADGSPAEWLVEETAKYYTKRRGETAFSYIDAPALALLAKRSAMLNGKQ